MTNLSPSSSLNAFGKLPQKFTRLAVATNFKSVFLLKKDDLAVVKWKRLFCEDASFETKVSSLRTYPLKHMVRILKSLLGQVALPLHLDVERLRDVGNHHVDQLADAKDDVLEDDHEGELEGEDLPMDWRECARVVSKTTIITLRLGKWESIIKMKMEFHFTIFHC